jgi:outer membrane protease
MKTYHVVILWVITAAGLCGEDYTHRLALGASLGLLNGQAEEIVYRTGRSDAYLSQLLWDMKPLVYAGADVHYHWQSPSRGWGVFTDVSVKLGIPMRTGVMEDRDWMNPGQLTHYSVSDNKTRGAALIDLTAGVSITLFDTLLLKPFLSYSFMRFSWTASGGYYLYPPQGDVIGDWPYGHGSLPDGPALTYTQTWNIIATGISFYGAFNRYFDADVSLKLSPFIWCTAVDNHLLRNLTITDSMWGVFFVEPSLLFSFTPNGFFKLSLAAAYRYIGGARGNSLYDPPVDGMRISWNTAGAGYSAVTIGLAATFTVLKTP